MYERNGTEQMRMILESFRDNLEEINPYHKADGTWGSKKNSKSYSLTNKAKKHLAKDSEVEIGKGKVTSTGKMSPRFGMAGPDPEKACGRLDMDGNKKKKTRSCKDYPKDYQEGLFVEPPAPLQATPDNTPKDLPSKNSKARTGPIRVKIYKKKRELDETGEQKDRPESEKRRKDRILPGYGDLESLAKGIMENQELEVPLPQLVQALKTFIAQNPKGRRELEKLLQPLGFYSSSNIRERAKQLGLYSMEDWLKIQNSQALAHKGELYKKQTK